MCVQPKANDSAGREKKEKDFLSFSEKKNVWWTTQSTFIKISHYLFQPSPLLFWNMLKRISDFMLFCSYKTMVKMIIFSLTFFSWTRADYTEAQFIQES